MALHCGEHDSSEYTPPFANISREAEESLLQNYRAITSEFFTGAKAFQKSCVNRERDFVDGSSSYNEYILFTGVSLEDMATVDRVRRSLPKMCCLYDSQEEVLIVKLMIGVGHEHASYRFSNILTGKLIALGLLDELIGLGSTRFGDGKKQKEADQSFKPIGSCLAIDAWPSLTFEVGFSESLPQLRNDARFWLTQSQWQTHIVLIIHIDRVHRQVDLER